MKSLRKLLLLLAGFTIFFFALRFYGSYINYNVDTLVSDLGGLTYLYSTVGAIFAIFAAFVIVSESQDWNTLVNASKNEVSEISELFAWSRKLSPQLAEKFSKNIQLYLEMVVAEEWETLAKGTKGNRAEESLSSFHELIADALKEDPELGSFIFTTFNNILNYRFVRVEHSWHPLPTILKFTVFFVDFVLVVLSFLIGVKNTGLDYLFMLCIVTLGAIVFFVINDLDNPLKPGEWYLKPEGYTELLSNIRSQNKL